MSHHGFDGASPSQEVDQHHDGTHSDAYELDMESMMNNEYVFDKAEDETGASDYEQHEQQQDEPEGDGSGEGNQVMYEADTNMDMDMDMQAADMGLNMPEQDEGKSENETRIDHASKDGTKLETSIIDGARENTNQPSRIDEENGSEHDAKSDKLDDELDSDRPSVTANKEEEVEGPKGVPSTSPITGNQGQEPQEAQKISEGLDDASMAVDQDTTLSTDNPSEPSIGEGQFNGTLAATDNQAQQLEDSNDGASSKVEEPEPKPEEGDEISPARPSISEQPPAEQGAGGSLPETTQQQSTAESPTSIPVHRSRRLEEPEDEDQESATKPVEPELLPQPHTIVIPSYAMWFDMNQIHEIESKCLPEFFSGKNKSKTPQVYKQYRDFMVNTYRLNPQEYLTLTACRRNLVGDVGALLRLHQFLEKWGLINYQVDAESRPINVAPPFTGHWKPLLDTPRGLFPFQFYKGLEDSAALVEGSTLNGGEQANGTKTSKQNGKANSNDENNNQTRMDVDVDGDVDVEANDREVDNQENSDQEGVTQRSAKRSKKSSWNKQEILRLLDGIEKTPHDWNSIADHVETKTRYECILKFVSLSIEDSYLEKENSSVNGKLGPLKYDVSQIPFSQADNPVMSVLAFLTGLVDPKVAATAAGKSLEELRKQADTVSDNTDDQKERKENGVVDSAQDSDAKDLEQEQGESKKASPAVSSDLSGDIPSLGSAATMAFALSGARSGVLANDVERQMYSNFLTIISKEYEKVERKLTMFQNLERSVEIERRELEKEKEQVFLDRLALHHKVRAVDSLLLRAIDEASPEKGQTEQAQATLQEARDIVTSGTSLSLEKVANDDEQEGSGDKTNEEIRPISMELPQTYRYWSG